MRPRRQLPSEAPFLTLWTTSYMRPQALARNFESVATQTAVEAVEQLVFPDHVGYGWDAMYARVGWYASAVRGRYIAWLNDDDRLVDRDVVARLIGVAARHLEPDVIAVRVRKGSVEFPKNGNVWPPVPGDVDLGNYVVRQDVWREHVTDYGRRYEGDYDHAAAMFRAGRRCVFEPILFAEGPASGGRTEVDWR